MPKEQNPLKVEETQQDFYVGIVERPNSYISEQKIHEKLGDIHKNRPKRLTDEEAEILRKWKELNLKDLPADWQDKYNNLIKASETLGEWKKVFGELKPAEVKVEYNKPKEVHGPNDLKPPTLPANWESELNKIPQLVKDSEDYAKWQGTLSQFLTKHGVDKLVDLNNYIENLKQSAQLTKEQQEAIKNYLVVKKERDDWLAVFPKQEATDIQKQISDKDKEINKWHTLLGGQTPEQVKNGLDKVNLQLEQKTKELEAWTNLFKKYSPQIYREKYDRKNFNLKQILIYVQDLKKLENG